MPSPAAPFKTSIEAALRASSDLQAAAGAKLQVFTVVPRNAALPYALIGDDQILLTVADPDCGASAEIHSTVQVWSLPAPPDKGMQARAMGSAIIDALNAQLEVAGWSVDDWSLTSERYQTDPDQSTHGILEFHYLLTQAVA